MSLVKRRTFMLVSVALVMTLSLFALVTYLRAAADTNTTYGDDTIVAGVDVAGLSQVQAVNEIEAEIANWRETPFLLTLEDGQTIEVEKDVFSFDVKGTLETITASGSYPLNVQVDTDRLAPYLEGQSITAAMISSGLGAEAGNLSSEWTIVRDDETASVVSEVTFETPKQADALLQALHGYEMKPGAVLSLKEFSDKHDLLDQIGSQVYRLFAATPFTILERVYHNDLPETAELGYDVKIEDKSNFAVENSEKTTYSLIVSQRGEQVTMQLVGRPFDAKYEARVMDVTTIAPSKVVRFSANLPAGTEELTQEGREGKSVKLYRVKTSAEGETMELLGFDFYEPLPEVVTKSSLEPEPPVDTEESMNEATDFWNDFNTEMNGTLGDLWNEDEMNAQFENVLNEEDWNAAITDMWVGLLSDEEFRSAIVDILEELLMQDSVNAQMAGILENLLTEGELDPETTTVVENLLNQ